MTPKSHPPPNTQVQGQRPGSEDVEGVPSASVTATHPFPMPVPGDPVALCICDLPEQAPDVWFVQLRSFSLLSSPGTGTAQDQTPVL